MEGIMLYSLILVIVASTGAILASERVSLGLKHIFIHVLLIMLFMAVAIYSLVNLFNGASIVALLSLPAVLAIGVVGRGIVKLVLVYFDLLDPEEV
jgi:hypothetical protein